VNNREKGDWGCVLTPQEYLDLLDSQGDEVADLEERVREAAAAPMRAVLASILAEFTKLWDIMSTRIETGDTSILTIISDLATRLESTIPNLRPQASESIQLGVIHAKQVDDKLDDPDWEDLQPDDDIDNLLDDMDTVVQSRVRTARRFIETGPVDKDRITTGIAMAGRSVNTVEIVASQVVVKGVDQGQRATAKKNDAVRIWKAERDACLHCLAYNGEVSTAGGGFAGGKTFGKKPATKPGSITNPPEHPRCRCTTGIYIQRNDPDGLVPEALKREAERSIIKGWTLPSESDAARRAAAEKLLALGTDLPKTVESEARRRLRRRGKFTTKVPG
jgi:hypothetical protein